MHRRRISTVSAPITIFSYTRFETSTFTNNGQRRRHCFYVCLSDNKFNCMVNVQWNNARPNALRRNILLVILSSEYQYKLKRCTNKECCKQCRCSEDIVTIGCV